MLKWDASSRWSFGLNSARDSKETATIEKTHLSLVHVIVFGQFYRVLKPTCESLFDYFWRRQDVHITENVCWLLKRCSKTDLKKY